MKNSFLRKVIGGVAIIGIGGALAYFVTWDWRWPDAASLLILTLTLIAIILYVDFTSQLASSEQERLQYETSAMVSPEFTVTSRAMPGEEPQFRMLVRFHNRSPHSVYGRVNFRFTISGNEVDYGPDYDGSTIWMLYPGEEVQGWIDFDALLAKGGETIVSMRDSYMPETRTEQLSLILEMNWRTDVGQWVNYPARRYYFVFDEFTWIPVLAGYSIL